MFESTSTPHSELTAASWDASTLRSDLTPQGKSKVELCLCDNTLVSTPSEPQTPFDTSFPVPGLEYESEGKGPSESVRQHLKEEDDCYAAEPARDTEEPPRSRRDFGFWMIILSLAMAVFLSALDLVAITMVLPAIARDLQSEKYVHFRRALQSDPRYEGRSRYQATFASDLMPCLSTLFTVSLGWDHHTRSAAQRFSPSLEVNSVRPLPSGARRFVCSLNTE